MDWRNKVIKTRRILAEKLKRDKFWEEAKSELSLNSYKNHKMYKPRENSLAKRVAENLSRKIKFNYEYVKVRYIKCVDKLEDMLLSVNIADRSPDKSMSLLIWCRLGEQF